MATKINNKVIVTGSKGFIGSHLMKALGSRGYNFDIRMSQTLDVNNARMLQAMILNVKPKVIVHLAAISSLKDVDRDPEQALKTNIVGTFNVLRLAKKYKVRVILASSGAVHESESSLYAVTKDCVEKLGRMHDNAIIMRFFNVYGKGSKSVVNKFIKQIKNAKIVTLNGNTTRDYIYIDDVVNAIMRVVDAKEPQSLYEVGTGRGVTLRKLISIIRKETNRPVHMREQKAIKEIQESQCMYPFDGIYKTTLEQGIRRLV
jgi:UDP-glucose 4-epimerase